MIFDRNENEPVIERISSCDGEWIAVNAPK